MLDYKIPIIDGNGFLKQTIDFDFGNRNFEIKKWKEMRENPRGLNTWISENGIVQSISSFFPFKNKILVNFNEGSKINHFLFLDNNFDIIYHVNELENDLDGMKLPMLSWAYTENEVVYYLGSDRFYNDYVETFKDKQVTVKSGNVHAFFQNKKEKLKDEKFVLVLLKVKD